MSALRLFTSRIWLPDPDLLNITIKTGGEAGAPFAPSLNLFLRAKRGLLSFGEYERLFEREMDASERVNIFAWASLLGRPRAVIACYCVDPAECHRGLVAARLVRRGATYGGEIALPRRTAATTSQLDLFAAQGPRS